MMNTRHMMLNGPSVLALCFFTVLTGCQDKSSTDIEKRLGETKRQGCAAQEVVQ